MKDVLTTDERIAYVSAMSGRAGGSKTKLLDIIDRLAAVVERLPVTTDGVRRCNDDSVWFVDWEGLHEGRVITAAQQGWMRIGPRWGHDDFDEFSTDEEGAPRVFSTPEATEAAAKKGDS